MSTDIIVLDNVKQRFCFSIKTIVFQFAIIITIKYQSDKVKKLLCAATKA